MIASDLNQTFLRDKVANDSPAQMNSKSTIFQNRDQDILKLQDSSEFDHNSTLKQFVQNPPSVVSKAPLAMIRPPSSPKK